MFSFSKGKNKLFGSFASDAIEGNPTGEKIFGFFGDDSIIAGEGDDTVYASFGDDTVEGGAGDDRVFGGQGTDTAVFAGSILDFSWTSILKNKIVVTDLNTADGDMGTDTLFSVERFQFDDFTLDLTRNNAPLLVTGDATTDEESPVTVSLQAFDFDGDTITLDSVAFAGAGTITVTESALAPNMGSSVHYDLSFDPNGDYEALGANESVVETVTITVSDGNGGTQTQSFDITINGLNDDPDAVDDSGAVDANATTIIDVLDNDTDVDANDVLTVSAFDAVSAAGGLVTQNLDGTFTYDPNGQFDGLAVGQTATDTFSYTVSDGNGGFDTATVAVTVTGTNAPPIANDDSGTAPEDGGTIVDALGNDADADPGDTLTITAFDAVSAGGGLVTNNGDGTFSYDTNGQFNGLADGESATDSFTYTISDGKGGFDTATVTITIEGANDGPTAGDDTGSTDEDTATLIDAFANDSDPDTNDVLTVRAFDAVSAKGGLVTDNGDGTFSYDPNGQFEGLGTGESETDSFTYTVSDGKGGVSTATVTVTIAGVNDRPDAQDDFAEFGEDGGSIDILLNDSDAEGPITLDSIDLVSANGVTLQLNEDGTVSYDPGAAGQGLYEGQSLTDTFSYSITDSEGLVETATVTVTVRGENDAPEAVADEATTAAATAVTISVLGNDTDADLGDTLSIDGFTQPENGRVEDLGGGQFLYTPAPGFEGTDGFTYTIVDSTGLTSTAEVIVTVGAAPNTPPTAQSGTLVFDSSEVITLDFNTLLLNELPVIDDLEQSIEALTITAIDVNTGGRFEAVFIETGADTDVFELDPSGLPIPEGGSITLQVTYTVDDGQGANSTATGLLSVVINDAGGPVNQAPEAQSVTITQNEDGGQIDINLLSGEGALASDPDGDALSVTGLTFTDARGNPLSFDPLERSGSSLVNGAFFIDPTVFGLEDGETGVFIANYTVSDGALSTSGQITFEITGTALNQAPVALDASITLSDPEDLVTSGGTRFEVDLGILSSDPDGDPITISVDGVFDDNGTPEDTSDDIAVTFTVADGIVQLFTFNLSLEPGDIDTLYINYTVSDGSLSDSGTVDLTLIGADLPPTGPTVEDFESFAPEEGFSALLSDLAGLRFEGARAEVFEVDELLLASGGRAVAPGYLNGQTTTGGDNVGAFVGDFLETNAAGDPLYSIEFYAPGGAVDIGAGFPSFEQNFGTAFDLESMSLTLLEGGPETVTIIPYRLVGPNPFQLSLEAVGEFEVTVGSDGALLLDFDALDFLGFDDPRTSEIEASAFDNIYAFQIVTTGQIDVTTDPRGGTSEAPRNDDVLIIDDFTLTF